MIVGRFQVNELHDGHLELFRQVSDRHERVIVFIGVPRTVPTKRNPLDFEVRKKMIQHDYPDFIILPLRDEKSDEFWSKRLDESIESVTQFTGSVTLYGGRDSFVPHYYGRFQVHQLDLPHPTTGTQVREKISNHVMQSKEFRAGAIYAAFNQFPRVLSTVDIAILHNNGKGGIKLLLGRKPGEPNYRFVGGFVNKGETIEAAARRETYEETGHDLSSVEYLGSYVVGDWRYSQDPDAGIVTMFFMGFAMTQLEKASDDIVEAKWFDFAHLPPVVEAEHMEMYQKIKKIVNQRFYNGGLQL